MSSDERNAADLFVECLEAEGVRYVFGIPGEETLELNRALARSSIEFVVVRHEQGGAYMADMYGRLTHSAGVCLGTLGPGATNLVTAVADAWLDRSPLVALTGQGDLERTHKESHQYIDVVSLLKPITKWNTRLNSAQMINEAVRKAFKVAQAQKPGPTHLELPEDVMASPVSKRPLPHRQERRRPEPAQNELQEAADIIAGADRPLILAGNGVLRADAAPALRAFAHATGMGVAATFMGKGVVDDDDPQWRGTVGMQARDYELAGFERADVIITVGYDLVEHAPVNWNPDGDKTIVCIDTVSAEVDEHFVTASDLIGDIDLILRKISGLVGTGAPATTTPSRLHELVRGVFQDGARDDAFPMHPPRVLWEIRQALGREDILISDVGLHKLWIARLYPAHEPNTVFIANGLAGMGVALPTGIAAKLVHPGRKVVTVSGDGGFLMNCQELETARRLGTAVVNVIWENEQYGSIAWKQDNRFGEHFGVDFTNPDFVALAQAFGLPGFRCEEVDDFPRHLAAALELDEPSIVVVPIDYSQDIGLQDQLGKETVAA